MISRDLQQQYDFIDLLKGFGIFLVVWGHTMIPRSVLIYSFHMPLFFFISGFLFKNKPLKEFVIGKINRLYLPYIIFTLFSWIFYLMMLEFQDHRDLIVKHLPKLLSLFSGTGRNGGNDSIWFLTCLIVVSVLFWSLTNLLKKSSSVLFATLVISGLGYFLSIRRIDLPFKVDVALVALVFYALGYYFRELDLLSWIKKMNRVVLIAFLILCQVLHFYIARLNIRLTGIPRVSMISNNLGNYFLFYLAAILAIIFLFIVGYQIGSIHWLNFLGHNSLIILGAHKPLLFLLRCLLDSYVNIGSRTYGVAASMAAIILTLPIIYVWNKKFPFYREKTLSSIAKFFNPDISWQTELHNQARPSNRPKYREGSPARHD
jgi:acyltransferase